MWPWKNPLQLLGKTSLRALLYFWKMPFYSKRNIQQKSASKLLQLISALLKNCPAETSLLLFRCWNSAADTSQLTVQKSPLLSCSPSLNLLMKEWIIFSSFSSFNITPSDFWVISKSNGWNRLRSRTEIKCSFKSHFLFFNSPHFNKDPLSHLFPKSLFLSNFSLTL